MGAILSLNGSKNRNSDLFAKSNKRQRTSSSDWDGNPRIIPNLPDEISIQILARLPRISYLTVKSVSRTWKSSIISPELYKLRRELKTTEEWLYILTKIDGDNLAWHALDPISRRWQKLPSMPNISTEEGSRRILSGLRMWNMVGSSIKIADAIRGWLGRRDALDRIPFCGCAIGAVDGCLYVLGGFSKSVAVNCAMKYDPISNNWSKIKPMSEGRAYCKTGVLNEKLFVVGGVSRGRGGLTPLQSSEVFDPKTGSWEPVPSMPFSKAQGLPTAFLADLLKPIATGLAMYRGKLYVPQSLYCWPFFVDVGGEVYDPDSGSWVEMPAGMGEGWPARQAGTKLSVVVDSELYALDPCSSLDSAKLKVYDHQEDSWKIIEGDVAIRDLADSESPYLLAGFLGKLHVITKDANHDIAVMQAERQTGSELETNVWRVLARRTGGSAELVSCQILDI
jgi:hypothetical protein